MNLKHTEYMVCAFHSEPPMELSNKKHFLQNHTVKTDTQNEAPMHCGF